MFYFVFLTKIKQKMLKIKEKVVSLSQKFNNYDVRIYSSEQ